MQCFVYILRCGNGTFYTGLTSDLQKRFKQHRDGESKYTKARLPVDLVYYTQVQNRTVARKLEVKIKDMRQKKKRALIEGFKLTQLTKKLASSASEKRV